MKKMITLITIVCLMISCSHDDKPPVEHVTNIELTPKTADLIQIKNDVGLSLFKQINTTYDESKNLMISPLSITQALSMVANGASGETLAEFNQLLNQDGLTRDTLNSINFHLVEQLLVHDSRVNFQLANSIWIKDDFPVRDEFIATNKKYYNAEVATLDFSNELHTLNVINSWVSDHTNGKIESILDQVSSVDVMYLINAIYYKATWRTNFPKENTQNRDFMAHQMLSVPTMNVENTFLYASFQDLDIIELPYGKSKFVFQALLPRTITVNQLINEITPQKLNDYEQEMDSVNMDLYMPRFEFAASMSLIQTLKALGLERAFTNGAQFADMTPDNVKISDVKHKTYIKTDEEGTEAAAVTAATIVTTSVNNNPVRLNKPFLFVIKEKDTGAILFIGKVVNPLLAN